MPRERTGLTDRGSGMLVTGVLFSLLALVWGDAWLLVPSVSLLVLPVGAFVRVAVPRRALSHRVAFRADRVFAPSPLALSWDVSAPPRRFAPRLLALAVDGVMTTPWRCSRAALRRSMEIASLGRGEHRAGPVSETVADPFGLASRRRIAPAASSIIVWPQVCDLSLDLRDLAPGASSSALRGTDEIDHLREYRAGDDPRRIHWRNSARTATLLVREERTALAPPIRVLLDDTMVGSALELGISLAASLLLALEVARHPAVLHSVRGVEIEHTAHRSPALDALALLRPDPLQDRPAALARSPRVDSRRTLLVTDPAGMAVLDRLGHAHRLALVVGPDTPWRGVDDLQRALDTALADAGGPAASPEYVLRGATHRTRGNQRPDRRA